MEQRMLAYLQWMMDKWQEEKSLYGLEDHMVKKRMYDMIACKEMVEYLLGKPVNLQLDGKVTTGF